MATTYSSGVFRVQATPRRFRTVPREEPRDGDGRQLSKELGQLAEDPPDRAGDSLHDGADSLHRNADSLRRNADSLHKAAGS